MKNRSVLVFYLVALVLFVGCNNSSCLNGLNKSISIKNIEFSMPDIQLPQIPDYEVNIIDFGAKSGGQELNTDAFEKAISVVSEKGGGKVVIPAGIWLTGPIVLKSNLELHTEAGALIVFSKNKNLYPLVKTSFEGVNTWRCMSPIYGVNLENIAFTGSGVWDGSGDAWRLVKKGKLTNNQWKKLVASGGVVNEKGNVWYPSEQYKKAEENADQNVRHDLKTKEDFEAMRDFLRPVMVNIQNSKRVLFDGPTFQNSPAWCIHPLIVEHLVVKNITVRNPWYSQNGDGIDIESCKNVLVENCSFDVGDDAICIKSGKDEDGRKRGISCKNMVIRNNIVYHGHGGVTVGSEMSGGVNNMHVSNCTFLGTDVGLRFKSCRGRGGVVENIFISQIQMFNIPTYAISFNLYYGGKSVSEMLKDGDKGGNAGGVPVSEETPQFKNISISDITVKGAQQGVLLQGLPEMNLKNVEIKNALMETDKGFSIVDATNVKIENVKLITKSKNAFEVFNCKNLQVSNLHYNFYAKNAISINGSRSRNISFNSENQDLKPYTKIGTEVPAGTVKY